ncbi:amino acid permease [Candidatus Woesearchaeota archaeon]|nr:amino acid permease [Candidatus Woesearchaeota archaeon]
MEQHDVPEAQVLKRSLGPVLILVMSFGSIMGTGMFLSAATGAKYGGPASVLAWPILLFVSLYIAGCFSELVSMFPKAGGIYEFCKQAYGRFPSFFVGWIGWTAGNLGNTLCVVAAMEYLLPGESAAIKLLLSIGLMLLLNLIALFGVEESAWLMLFFVAVTVVILIVVILRGIGQFNPGLYEPFLPMGMLPVAVAGFFFFEALFGWESVTYLAEETQNPERNIPKALMRGTLLVGLASFGVHLISYGVVPWQSLAGSQAPLALVISRLFPVSYELPLRIGVFLMLVGSAAGGVVSMPRLLLALARDRLFLTQMGAVHPRFHTPYRAIAFQAIASMVIIGLTIGRLQKLLSLLVPLGLLLYAATVLAVPALRKKHPYADRPFKVPLARLGPYATVLFFVALVAVWLHVESLALPLLLLGASLVLVGLPLYLLIEMYYDPEMITSARDLTAHVALFSEGLLIPRSVRQEIFAWFGDLRGKSVLEFGCGTGTLTLQLAESVGADGVVFATDLSVNNLKIAKRRIEQEVWRSHALLHGRVHIIHDHQHTVRVHPRVSSIDAAVSFGMLSYIQEVDKVLGEIRALLPEGGKICFVEYVDYFKILPNPEWLGRNVEIERIFRKSGFSVQVQRRRGLLWNYVFLYGIKSRIDVPVV